MLECAPFQPRFQLMRSPLPPSPEALRGVLLHRFLQERIRAPFDKITAWNWLKQKAKEMRLAEEIVSSLPIDALLALPFCPEFVFLQKGKAEVSIFEKGQVLRLDSLYVDDSRAVIIEIKTGERLSQNLAGLPTTYIQQVGAYRRVVQKLFPDRPVNAFLLETETAHFIPFEDV